MKENKDFNNNGTQDEPRVLRGVFFALLLEAIGFMVICGLYRILMVVINYVF